MFLLTILSVWAERGRDRGKAGGSGEERKEANS